MIFMQQMQYNAPNRRNVFEFFSEGDTPGSNFGALTQKLVPLLQNPD